VGKNKEMRMPFLCVCPPQNPEVLDPVTKASAIVELKRLRFDFVAFLW
jgi:hypothetical protein